MKDNIAKFIRIISIPPFMVTSMVLIIAKYNDQIFKNTSQIVLIILFLGFFPVLAYPLQKLIPKYNDQGRQGQRKLAFIFTIIGYALAFLITCCLSFTSSEVYLIVLTYFLSVINLTIVNKSMNIKASGHACSFTSPIIFLTCFVSWKALIPCILFAVAICWSSLYLKRHTKEQLIEGIIVCIFSYLIALLFVRLLFI